jgi:NADPH:quinone reductase-like Zn-dependent oxidoreductase
MEQIWIPRIGEPSVLEIRHAPDPIPGPGEVRVQVDAAGVNFADLMARMGLYPDAPPLPAVVGYEVAGTIDQVGEGVDEDRIGQKVVALTQFGGYGSAVVLPAYQAIVRPENMDAITGAAIPVTGLTSWMMLEIMGGLKADDRVLVHSAGGGVGLAALDLIKWRGATAVGTASAHKHSFLKQKGYSKLIDYRSEDFEETLSGDEGFDLILDPVGGESWSKGLRLLRSGGRLVCFGMSSNAAGKKRSVFTALRNLWGIPWTRFNPIWLINHNVGVLGVNMGHLWDEGERLTGWLDSLLQLWAQGHLQPVVHATVPYTDAAEAHRILHDRENLGKVVLSFEGLR